MPMSIKRNPIKHKNSDFFITYGIPHTAPTSPPPPKKIQKTKAGFKARREHTRQVNYRV